MVGFQAQVRRQATPAVSQAMVPDGRLGEIRSGRSARRAKCAAHGRE
jgi:hypothetical protein